MFPSYYHNPPKPVSTRVRCPVCQKEVYSRAGIHPQCAAKRWESQNGRVTLGDCFPKAPTDPDMHN
jgi:hypothetical protein